MGEGHPGRLVGSLCGLFGSVLLLGWLAQWEARREETLPLVVVAQVPCQEGHEPSTVVDLTHSHELADERRSECEAVTSCDPDDASLPDGKGHVVQGVAWRWRLSVEVARRWLVCARRGPVAQGLVRADVVEGRPPCVEALLLRQQRARRRPRRFLLER